MASSRTTPPFAFEHQLTRELDDLSRQRLPGHPSVRLSDRHGLWDCLDRELWAEDMDRIAHRLWWMAKQDSASISPLHRQLVKRRVVVVTEDPKLHLVWIHGWIFIKPLPRYLCSYKFWQDHLCNDDAQTRRVRTAALGHLRTYCHLVRHESDFRMAQDPSLCLLPSDVTWEQFVDFASDVARITDQEVSARYAYGEIRLTRLNFYAPFLLGRSHFQRVDYQYGAFFARFYGPILFFMGGASVVLSGLQVSAAVEQNKTLGSAALWFSITVMTIFCGVFASLSLLLVYKVATEWRVAVRDRLRLLEERRVNVMAGGC
ncbi:subtilisin-like serine protease protein [Pleurostoma richardsiae]|uniref:Subtilisin-like serine protease protein n=1 Tax=Pleurostoma richardsiae TaxID=41990 RepID=A0AA38RM09_9PEZI|nr:subtilisin-like serine protease protein [Pleurostoma richardsiae]